jgi:hypothetical protein
MDTSAFDILIMPTLWVTFGGVVAGSALLFLMRTVENAVGHLSRASRSWREIGPIAGDPLPRTTRRFARCATRLHG